MSSDATSTSNSDSDSERDPSRLAELSCAACDELLIDHVYGETAAGDRVAVASHLAECSTCAVSYCRLKADLDGVLEAAVEAPPAAVRRRIREGVARAFAPSWWDRTVELWRHPVPAYGVVVASLIPVMVWVAASMRPVHVDAQRSPAARAERPPALIDYDSMVPLLPEDRPL